VYNSACCIVPNIYLLITLEKCWFYV
jgi:hypothetical protein